MFIPCPRSRVRVLHSTLFLAQDFRRDTAMSMACLTAADLILMPERYAAHDRRQVLASAMQFCAEVGLSRNDLPETLRSKLDEWLSEAAGTEGRTVEPRGKRAASGKQEPKKKKAKAAETSRKRKSRRDS